MAKSKILFSTWVKEIIGSNDEMFGYIIFNEGKKL